MNVEKYIHMLGPVNSKSTTLKEYKEELEEIRKKRLVALQEFKDDVVEIFWDGHEDLRSPLEIIVDASQRAHGNVAFYAIWKAVLKQIELNETFVPYFKLYHVSYSDKSYVINAISSKSAVTLVDPYAKLEHVDCTCIGTSINNKFEVIT